MGHGIGTVGSDVWPVQVHHDEIGPPADRDRADFVFESERPRPAQRRELEHLPRGERVRAEARLLDQRGEAHLGEHVEPVVAGCPVRAECDAASRLEQLRHFGDPAAQLQVR